MSENRIPHLFAKTLGVLGGFAALTYLAGQASRFAKKFNWKKGALHLARYLQSSAEEIREGGALGKHTLGEVNKYDLVALDEVTSEIALVPIAYSKRKTRAGSPLLGK